MKLKIYITLLLLLVVGLTHAQVGIGTTSPNASSMLDITSTNSGLLIPRVALTSVSDVTTIASPVTSLLVYNSGFSPNGYYYWNGTIWVQLATVNNTNWSLTGNSGTSAATNFLGTTDDVDIVFKRFNTRAGFIGNPNTSTGNKNTSFGANSLNAAGTGIRNTAIGTNVMPSNTTGQLNVSIGDQSMFSNQGGSTNTVIGVGALFSNTSGSENVAIGRQALTSANANANTALGFATLRQNASGINNVAIGHQAAYNETGSNKLYIEMSTGVNGVDSSVDNALIYGEFDNRIVRTNGTIQVGNPATTGYAFPTNRGTSGQVLQTNGAGVTSWTTANNTLSVVRTNLSTNQSLGTSGWQKVSFNTVVFDANSEFNTGTNRFVAAKTGYYEINAGFHTFNQSDNNYYGIAVYKNGSEYQETSAHHYGINLISRTINCLISLTAGDYIEIYAHNTFSGTTIDSFSGKTYFEVKQIR
ncbi:complement C1q domain-containing protein [Flavobacterium sp. N1994]|uniref:complement C1q domain-containing protein n=1 Tax=Flavobacterium sp. N1994 TaxID=2986827 RepID=UPI00222202F5|nr:complement C1q domain-containing protein [Flavobacterium sp. N1994]